jgi:hypothetical protein
LQKNHSPSFNLKNTAMKKIILSVFVFSVLFSSAYAQEKRINLYGAYVFDDEVSAYDSYNYGFGGKIKGGFQYGAGLEFISHKDIGFELLWIGQTTQGQLNYYNSYYVGGTPLTLDLNLNFAMLGINRYMRNPDSKVETFAGIMLGCLFESAKYQDFSQSAEKFSWGLRLGANIWASEKIAVKLQAQILSAVQAAGGSVYFGTGGTGAGVSTYSSMLQCSLGGGLTYAFGK